MVAGEASGDLLAGLLLQALKVGTPDLTAQGIGGPQMQRQNFDAWWPSHKLAVHGFGWEVLLRYREIVGIRNQLRKRLLRNPPSVFIGVDAPDFNLDLEAALKSQGIKTVHFVCPSVWAWRAERLEKIRRSVDHVLCIFPFEPALLAQHGIASTFVGHPLAQVIPMDVDRNAARALLALDSTDEVVALLPGSRVSEIKNLAARFFQAAVYIHKARPAVKFIVPTVPGLLPMVQALAKASGIAHRLQLLQGQSHTALAACDVTLVASGTASLEAALYKRPMVIAYHMAWFSWRLMNAKRLQPWVGLPNILSNAFVVPELLQEQATPSALAQAVLHWLEMRSSGSPKIRELEEKFTLLHRSLRCDTASVAANAIQNIIQS
jgi:lipid-A-disaccharide synthase